MPSGYSQGSRIRFDVIGEAWSLFQQQMGVWIGAMVVMMLAVGVIYGIMMVMLMPLMAAGGGRNSQPNPMIFLFLPVIYLLMFAVMAVLSGGMYRMAIKQVRGETPVVGDVFSAVDVFPSLLGVMILTAIGTGLGAMLCVVPGLLVGGMLMFALPLVVDKRMGAMEAVSTSWEALKPEMVMAAVFLIVIQLVAGLGAILCGVGALFTAPLAPLSIALLYRDFFMGPTGMGPGGTGAPLGPYTPQPTAPIPEPGSDMPRSSNMPGSSDLSGSDKPGGPEAKSF
jgi:hypothetical protein